jgi:hypothetical protein
LPMNSSPTNGPPKQKLVKSISVSENITTDSPG